MSTLGDIVSTSGGIMMHVGERVGKNLSISIENLDVLNIPPCTHDIPPMYSCYPPDVLNIPRCTEHPPMYRTHIIQGDKSNVVLTAAL